MNVLNQLLQMPVWLYFSRPFNLAFHNLTDNAMIPANIWSLLGLGLKFCFWEGKTIGKKAIDYDRFRKDLYTRIFFAGEEREIPALFIRSKWEPPPSLVPDEAKAHLSWFIWKLKQEFIRQKDHSNLTVHQKAAVRFLNNHPKLVILKTDKNLGPAIIK